MLQALREKRGKLAHEIQKRAEAAKGRAFTSEEESNWTELNGDYNDVVQQIQRAERAESIALENAIPTGDEDRGAPPEDRAGPTLVEARDLAAQAFFLAGKHPEAITDEQRAACRMLNVNPTAREVEIPLLNQRELRALQVGTDSEGGYTVPEGFVNSLEKSMLAFGNVRGVSRVLRTSSGNALPWPTANDTGNTGELLAEEADATTNADPSFGVVTFNAYKFSSKMVKLSAELLQDAAFDLASEIGLMLGERLGRVQNTYQTTGTGTAQPKGVAVASGLGKTAAGAAAITAAELIDLYHSLDPAYRNGAAWMMKDSTVALVRKLVDGNSQFLWQPGLQAGIPDVILGHPLHVNSDMPAATTGLKSVLFGAFSKYVVREVAGIRLRRLVELYAGNDQEAYIAFMRSDADLLDAGTDPIKHLIQA